jgi:ribosomal protein L17
MAQLPESNFEKMTAEAREKERLERQKMLVSLPQAKVEQEYLAAAATKVVELREIIEDLVLAANEVTDAAQKQKLVQGTRGALEKMARLHRMSLVAAKEGPDCAQRLYNPAPTYTEMEEEERKELEKYRKEKEASKKKETAEQGKSGWKGVKRPFPYSKPGYSGYGGYGGGLNSWALQQVLLQQLSKNGEASGQSGSGSSKGAGGSGGGQQGQDGGYAAKIALARIQYPCHACGVLGHWKKDGECKPADIAAHIKRRMAEQAAQETEENDESGMNI